MKAVDRRTFFSFGMYAAGLSTTPAWLARWFAPQAPQEPQAPTARQPGGQQPEPPSREQQLRVALARAQREQRPVLVFVVPEDASRSWRLGHFFGAYLNHAGREALREVGLCVPACASIAELQHVTGAGPIEGEPQFALVDSAHPAKTTAIAAELRWPAGFTAEPTLEWQQQRDQEQRCLETDFTALTAALVKGLHRHGANLATLAERVRGALAVNERAALAAWFDGGDGGEQPADELLVRAAAVVRDEAGRRSDARREQLMAALGVAIEHELVAKKVAGATWMVPGGCGSRPENPPPRKENEPMIACGMAVIPPLCERFLSFYVQ